MRITKYTYVFILGFVSIVASCQPIEVNFDASVFNKNIGYVLTSETTQQQSNAYDYIGEIEHTLIAVGLKNKYEAVNRRGEEVIPIEYEFVKIYEHITVAYFVKGKYLKAYWVDVYDNNGKKILTENFDPITPEIFFAVKDGATGSLYDKYGKLLSKTDNIKKFGVTVVMPNVFEFKGEDGSMKYMNATGEFLSRPKFMLPKTRIEKDFSKSDYLLVLDEKGVQHIINQEEEIQHIEALSAYEIYLISYNYAIVKPKDKEKNYYRLYDLVNRVLLPNVYSNDFIHVSRCENEEDGAIYLHVRDGGTRLILLTENDTLTFHKKYIVDVCGTNPEKYRIKHWLAYDSLFKFYKGEGEENYFRSNNSRKVYPVKDLQMKEITSQTDGQRFTMVHRQNQFGLINKDFEIVVPTQYDEIKQVGYFTNRYFIYDGDKVGITDNLGNVVLEPEYQFIQFIGGRHLESGILICKKNDQYTVHAYSGHKIFDNDFSSFEDLGLAGFQLKDANGETVTLEIMKPRKWDSIKNREDQ